MHEIRILLQTKNDKFLGKEASYYGEISAYNWFCASSCCM